MFGDQYSDLGQVFHFIWLGQVFAFRCIPNRNQCEQWTAIYEHS